MAIQIGLPTASLATVRSGRGGLAIGAVLSGLVTLSLVLVPVTAASADDATPAAAEFVEHLEELDSTRADVALDQFEALEPADQEVFLDVLADPAFIDELLTLTQGFEPHTSDYSEVIESEEFPGVVEERIEYSVEEPMDHAGKYGRSKYPANSTQKGTWTATANVLGIDVTRLTIWVTFTTDGIGVPKKVVSSGSGSFNLNFLISIGSTNHAPYIQLPSKIAVASTTWHGCVVYRGSGACFDKVQTAKFWQGGLYSASIRNI